MPDLADQTPPNIPPLPPDHQNPPLAASKKNHRLPRRIIIYLILTALLILASLLSANNRPPHTPYLSIKPSADFAHQWELEPQPLRQIIYPPQGKLNKIGLALSPYGGEPVGEVTITLRDQKGDQLFQGKIPASDIKPDQMIYLEDLDIIGLKGRQLVIEINSSLPSFQTNIAARYTDADNQMPGSHIIRAGNLLEGTLAMELY